MFRERKHTSRLAMILCLAILLGLLPTGLYGTALYVNAAADNILTNGDFEADSMRPLNWNVNAPTMSCAFVVSGAQGNNTRVFSMKNMGTSYLEVDSDWFGIVPNGQYRLTLRAMIDRSVEPSAGWNPNFTAFVMWYNKEGKLDAKSISVKPKDQWQEFSMDVTIPDYATGAAIRLYISAGKNMGCFVDDISLVKTGGPDGPVVQPPETTTPSLPPLGPVNDPTIPNYTQPTVPKDYIAPTVTDFPDQHPCLYFNTDELAEMKKLTKDPTKTVYGFSWKGQLDNLLCMAQNYLIETTVRQNSNYGTSVSFEVYPHLKDPNDPSYRPMYIQASTSSNGTLVEKPYLGFGCLLTGSMKTRMETLSLAYALTGDTMYSDLAIRYAVEMSQWKWWGDWNWLYTYTNGVWTADACCAWATQGVAAVYDLCYDQLTQDEKKIIETAIIEKGLKPVSNAVDAKSMTNGNMMYIGGLLTGCAAIINEDNYAQLKPYVDLALYCVETAYDNYAYSGNTEGHYYTSFGLEYFLPGVAHMYRATELDVLFDHPLMSDMLPYWTVQFSASGTMTHPNYSDANVSSYMKLPMAIISKNVGDGLAGYFMTKAGGLGSAWLNLVYLDPTPAVEMPTDYVSVVDPIGYGGLRTGFASGDMLLTLLANNSQMGHNHWDQNSIQLAIGGTWLLKDPGVGSYYYKNRTFWQKTGHSTILVNGSSQTVKGMGSMQKVFDNQSYGYIIGSAPRAYGSGVLTRFDRHAIQINHKEKAYYILIDDLASSKNNTYGWQMYNGDRDVFSVDGVAVGSGSSSYGNNVTMTVSGHQVNLTFVDNDKLSISDQLHYGKDEDNKQFLAGHTLVATSAATKAHQFMVVLSIDNAVKVAEKYDTTDVLAAVINYAGELEDFVLFNRTNGRVTAGALNTDAQQASLLGMGGDAICEGYAATRATMLSYNGEILFNCQTPLNIVADTKGWTVDSASSQIVRLYIGEGDYDVFINGKNSEAEISNGMATFVITSGTSEIVLKDAVHNEPTEPSVPEQPTEPSVPEQPTEPSVPEQPTEPSATEESTEPSAPADPTETTAPSDPVAPADPTEETQPSEPIETTTPTEATGPIVSTEPPEDMDDADNDSDNSVVFIAVIVAAVLAGVSVLLFLFRRKILKAK